MKNNEKVGKTLISELVQSTRSFETITQINQI